MKYFIRILKLWKDPEGKEWDAGKELEINLEDVAKQAIFDGFAERIEKLTEAKTKDDDTKTIVIDDEAVAKAVKTALDDEDLQKNLARNIHSISVSDKQDEDPFHGFAGDLVKDKYTDDEKTWALGNFAQDVIMAGEGMTRPSERLAKSIERSAKMQEKAAGDGMQAGVQSEAGALIPPAINTMLLDQAAIRATIRPLATKVSLDGNQLTLPQVKDYDRSSSLVYGGVLGYWKGEDAQLSESKPVLEELEMHLHALTVLAYASHQSMRFPSIAMGAYLLPKMADAITFKEEDAFINGNGAGMPMGILDAPGAVSIAIESGQTAAANTIVVDNIDKMEQQLKVSMASSVRWMYNRSELFVYLRQLAREVGTGGQLANLFEFGGFGAETKSNLDGIPIMDLEHMPAAGTVGDLSLVDWSRYLVADDRQGPESAQSMHLKFDYGQTAFRIIKYVDAQPMDSDSYTNHKGSTNDTSPILSIAVRT